MDHEWTLGSKPRNRLESLGLESTGCTKGRKGLRQAKNSSARDKSLYAKQRTLQQRGRRDAGLRLLNPECKRML